MESLWKLAYLLEPASVALIATAIFVTFASASRALDHGKEMERNLDFSEASITLDRSQALMIPLASSCSLLLMFYLFSSVSQLITAFTAVASVSALYFCLSPSMAYIRSQFCLLDPLVSRCCSKSFTRTQGILLLFCIGTVSAWLVTGHWLLNNILGICICIAFVSHVRLPNIKICALLLVCLFLYDIFWVFFSERFFGANVMVSVATQKASNPIHKVATSLSLPGLQLITKKLELPVKLVFPRNLISGQVNTGTGGGEYMMLGLGDMAIPGMLLALVLCFDHRKTRDMAIPLEKSSSKGSKYLWCALSGYAIGLVTALSAGILTQSPQPALLYLDDFLPRTATPLEDIFKSLFCLPCLLCLRCMRDTCIPEEVMLKDPRRLYAPGRLYHIVERKPLRFGRYPPVVRTAVPVDGRFEHIVLSCNATSDHAIVWIEREAQRALDLMLEKDKVMEIPAQQRMERQETLAKEHREEHKAALRRAVTLSVPDAFSPTAYGTFDEKTSEAEGNSPSSSSKSRQRMSWNELIERIFEKNDSGHMVLRKSSSNN